MAETGRVWILGCFNRITQIRMTVPRYARRSSPFLGGPRQPKIPSVSSLKSIKSSSGKKKAEAQGFLPPARGRRYFLAAQSEQG